MVNLDRFAAGRPDPQAEYPVAICDGCNGAIYAEDDVYVLDDGTVIHADNECLCHHAGATKKRAGELMRR